MKPLRMRSRSWLQFVGCAGSFLGVSLLPQLQGCAMMRLRMRDRSWLQFVGSSSLGVVVRIVGHHHGALDLFHGMTLSEASEFLFRPRPGSIS